LSSEKGICGGQFSGATQNTNTKMFLNILKLMFITKILYLDFLVAVWVVLDMHVNAMVLPLAAGSVPAEKPGKNFPHGTVNS
jgi:hypothetical protein